jgi:asparagine synthetase B (glutamine-hydrolysing)
LIFCDKLDFAFVIVDGDNYMAARDPLGVKPYIMVWMNEEEFILPPK